MSNTHKLSKSRFLSGYQCDKKLWLEKHRPDLKAPFSASQQRILDQGTRVGELAREHFPGGALIEADHLHIPEAIEETKQALQQGSSILFEGSFIYQDILVRPDIMVQQADQSWQLIEVKSTTKVKPEHVIDVAIQRYVLEGCGLNTASCHLMHINNQCVFPDLQDLFAIADITTQVDGIIDTMPDTVTAFFQVLDTEKEIQRSIGSHCTSPYECPFIPFCWQEVPDYSVFTIPRVSVNLLEEHIQTDRLALETIDPAEIRSKNQQKYLRSYQQKKPLIDVDSIRGKLQELTYPLYFLDFETDGPAIPRFEGMHPFEQFPFQFSCHILHGNGTLEHAEYLHDDTSDPRRPLADTLLNAVGPIGSIIAYNASFEQRIIRALARWLPDLSSQLTLFLNRFWDQLIIFRNYYTDYRFQGSNSIKNVLPVLAPELSYDQLEVSDGTAAQTSWNNMIVSTDPTEKKQMIIALKAYCGQDTLAMVRIHEVLSQLK